MFWRRRSKVAPTPPTQRKEPPIKRKCITRNEVFNALTILAHIEGKAEASSDYSETISLFRKEIAEYREILSQYARQMQPASLEAMQREFYLITGHEDFQETVVTSVSVRTHLTSAWHNIGPWRK
jgi:hypothetical protein